MSDPAIQRLLGLGLVILISVGALLMLLHFSRRKTTPGSITAGYPPALFPAQHLTQSGALAALVATQARLLSLAQQLPTQSYLAIWLGTFMQELRAIMDTAYRVAVITEIYGQPDQLTQLVAEVQQIEIEIAGHVAHRLLARDGANTPDELLEGRLAVLRLCVRELASDAPSL